MTCDQSRRSVLHTIHIVHHKYKPKFKDLWVFISSQASKHYNYLKLPTKIFVCISLIQNNAKNQLTLWIRVLLQGGKNLVCKCLRLTLTVISHPHLGLLSGCFPWNFPTKALYAFHFFHKCHMPCPSHPPWFGLSKNIYTKHKAVHYTIPMKLLLLPLTPAEYLPHY